MREKSHRQKYEGDANDMNTITYGITEEIYSIGGESRISYGIAAYQNVSEDATATVVASVHNITEDKAGLTEIVDACNRQGLSVCHLLDVVEDFLEA